MREGAISSPCYWDVFSAVTHADPILSIGGGGSAFLPDEKELTKKAPQIPGADYKSFSGTF